ncbi:MAG: LysM peptidoglycan-binding domain-containing protein [Chloroflexi bacterium]|nr:LysM peptidoglycan-binding domain-containing protein [Chloroflexota bacterium]
MNPKRFFVLFTLISLLLFGLWLPANAASNMQQVIPTATPGADGRILYVVQPGDSCFRVAAIHSITVDQLRQLNSKLDENCTLIEGQELLIGIVSTEGTPTAGPSPTPAPPTASPTPFTGTTEICVLLFNDINGDALRQETEPAVAGGAVSVTENNGEYSAAQNTEIPADPETYQGICFINVPEGSYNITMGIPDNYNPTVSLNYSLEVKAGDRAEVSFGIQSKEVVADTTGGGQNPPEPKTSPIFGIIGGLLLLGGAGLGYFAWRSGKPESKLSGGSGMLKKK